MTLVEPLLRPADGEATPDPRLPEPRGPRSAHLLAALRRPVHELDALPPAGPGDDPLVGEDGALSLHLLYELHYRGFAGVDERWEWEPSLLAAARRLESELEAALVAEVGPPSAALDAEAVGAELDRLAAADGPSLSAWVLEHATLGQLREFVVHRSIYQRKEADPHTFGIPRLRGPAKTAFVEIQHGEYGTGRPEEAHSSLFAWTMRHLGLDPTYGAYLDHVPAATLATDNLLTLFGVHRRWRGALVGHLAHFEMCSVEPMGRYAAALRRHGVHEAGVRFYDVHVEADEWHARIARDDMAVALVRAEPHLAGDVAFGARALAAVEGRFARHLLDAWSGGRSSLRVALDGAGAYAPT